jgi:hypothetical protein
VSLLPLLLAGLPAVGGALQVELVVELQPGGQKVLHHHYTHILGIACTNNRTNQEETNRGNQASCIRKEDQAPLLQLSSLSLSLSLSVWKEEVSPFFAY